MRFIIWREQCNRPIIKQSYENVPHSFSITHGMLSVLRGGKTRRFLLMELSLLDSVTLKKWFCRFADMFLEGGALESSCSIRRLWVRLSRIA